MIRMKAAVWVAALVAAALPAVAAAQTQASISAASSSRIVPTPPNFAFPADKYVYSVQWRFMNAGTSTVQIGRSGSSEHVTATATSVGFPDKIFRVRDIFNADVDSHNFCTLQVFKHSEEGPRHRETKIAMNYARLKSEVDLKDLKSSETTHSEFDIPACTTDVVSGFYYVASLPLAPGFSQTFPVNDNGKTTDVTVHVEARDRVKGPTGEYQTLRVSAVPLSGPMKGKGVLWVWFSDDSRRLPVQMKSKLGFATLLFELQKIETAAAAK